MKTITIMGIAIFIMLAVVGKAAADIYRSFSKDGVECYTDAPVDRSSVLVIREHRRVKSRGLKSTRTPSNKRSNLKSGKLSKSRSLKQKTVALPVDGLITSTVGLRYDPFNGLLKNHQGVDIAVPEGTPVNPVAPGRVSFSGSRGGYGNIVIIEHENGMTTLYAHNSMNRSVLGDTVDENSTIALSGSTGRSTGPHLHFEAWLEGENITSEFLGDPSSVRRNSGVLASSQKVHVMRKVVMADGSIVLTNLPLLHP